MCSVDEMIKLCDDPKILGGLQELALLRRSQIQPAVKYLSSSIDKQYRHMESEMTEIVREFRDGYNFFKEIEYENINKDKIAMEVIDLQFSCQTMLEGPLGLTKEQIANYIQLVVEKNNDRGYDVK